MKTVLKTAFWFWIVAGVLTIIAGFGGRVHPFGDTLALLRLPLAVVCLLCAVFLMRGWIRPALAFVCVGALATVAPLLVGGRTGGTFTIYTKNLFYYNATLDLLAVDIHDSGADVVTLQELGTHNDPLLDMLAQTYPHQHLCRLSGWSGIAVLSKTPFVSPPRCSARRAMAAAQTIHAGQRVWVASVHLPWPYPYDHEPSALSALDVLAQLDGPVVIGGDFNTFPWASSAVRIRQASNTRIAGPVRPTFNLYGVPLFLDHVYAPRGGSVRYRGMLGSDHRGVLAQVRL